MVNGIISLIIFFIFVIAVEIVFQVMKRKETPYITPSQNISIEEFNIRIRKGDELVILDDMILDVSKFKSHHPGGRFVINHNIGRDISKFFYGGYTLENYEGLKPYTHSNIARTVVNTIIVG